MERLDLKIKDYATISIYSEDKDLANKLNSSFKTFSKTIPITYSKSLSVNYVDNKDCIIILESQISKMNYDLENNVATIFDTQKNIRILDLVYILLSMFSKKLQDNQKYLVHSSVVKAPSGDAIMVVGEANTGKTSLAYKMMQDYHCKLISNDHAIVGFEDNKLKVYGGTKEIQMRLGAMQLYFPELFKTISKENDINDIWNKKIVINDYLNLEQFAGMNDITDISQIYNLSVNNNGTTYVSKKNQIDKLLFLYESISRQIKGTYNLITGYNYPMPSVETRTSLKNLVDNCSLSIDSYDIYDGKGDISELAKILVRNNER